MSLPVPWHRIWLDCLPLPGTVGGKKVGPERISSAREAVRVRAVAFARKHDMNWYKKAHLTNTFKWVLRESGYDDKFIGAWTYDLIFFISPKNSTT